MRRTIISLLSLFILFALVGAGPVFAQSSGESVSVSLNPSAASAAPGESLELSLRLDGGPTVAAFTMELTVDGHFAVDSVSPAAIPAECLSYRIDGDRVMLLYLDTTGGDQPVLPPSGLLTIQLRALSATSGGVSPVSVAASSFSGVVEGQTLNYTAQVSTGQVRVSAGQAVPSSSTAPTVVVEGQPQTPTAVGGASGTTGPNANQPNPVELIGEESSPAGAPAVIGGQEGIPLPEGDASAAAGLATPGDNLPYTPPGEAEQPIRWSPVFIILLALLGVALAVLVGVLVWRRVRGGKEDSQGQAPDGYDGYPDDY